jgi:predicted glycosyl hydrolase (DUF1957 family)
VAGLMGGRGKRYPDTVRPVASTVPRQQAKTRQEETTMTVQIENASHRLISGSFTPEDAREVLMVMLDDKISFHRRRNWSDQERFGEVDSRGLKRIDELQQTKQEVAQLLEEAAEAGVNLRIHCNIDIQLDTD